MSRDTVALLREQPTPKKKARPKQKPPAPKGLSDKDVAEALDDGSPRPVDMAEFWGKPAEPIRYLIEPLLAEGEITRLYAQAKVGKSLLIQECAAALATGNAVLGQEVEPLDVLYIDQENTQNNWKTNLTDMGYGPDDDWRRFHWYSLQAWPALDTKAGGAAVVAKVEQHGAQLVVLDTQSKFLEGEEDKQATQQAFYLHTLIPLKRLGVAVVIIDHAGNDPMKPRGSSGKRDDVDTVWRATRFKNRLTLTRTHQRSPHAVDALVIDRLLDPLRHVLADEVKKAEQGEAECLTALQALGFTGNGSGRSALEKLRATRQAEGLKGFRDKEFWAAWKALKEEAE
jgi:hypothetical protein